MMRAGLPAGPPVSMAWSRPTISRESLFFSAISGTSMSFSLMAAVARKSSQEEQPSCSAIQREACLVEVMVWPGSVLKNFFA
jgi:hypothetical protein